MDWQVLMITLNELLSEHNISELNDEQKNNLNILLERINQLRVAWAKSMTITSGFRSKEDQLRIYRSRGVPDDKIPMNSAHLKGCACDVLDVDGSLMAWVKLNELLLISIGLWVEDDVSQPRVHFQIYAPKSGHRYFKP